MKIKYILVLLISTLVLASCKVEPKEIAYGKNNCALCDMTVVSKTHASQYVTKKGKTYMFDAIECMVMKINRENNEDLMAFILVSDYSSPGNLVNAKDATYLISEKIKSPMGANLSAFKSKEDAINKHKEFGGELYTWEQLKIKLK